MAYIKQSKYKTRPFYLFNRHLETIVPSLIFFPQGVPYIRERLELPDGDFLDLDWLRQGSKRLVLLSHGMEGSTDRYYIRRMASFFFERSWDILAWNTRGCGGEMNRLPVVTHHGAHDDLKAVIDHALTKDYGQIVLIGLSMGGNLTIKYLNKENQDDRVIGAVTFSVTGDMKSMTSKLEERSNRLYKNSFLALMKERIKKLSAQHPREVDPSWLPAIKSFEDFHLHYSVPMNNFRNLEEFYYETSANNFVERISSPVLMVNALNDPLLNSESHPKMSASRHDQFHLETPRYGGHLGFNYLRGTYSYMEYRSELFINEIVHDQV